MSKTKTQPEVLAPDSPRWNEFTQELARCPCDGDSGPNVHRYAKQIMRRMGGIDIPGSLEFFEEHGGYCDCEILLNVDHEWLWAGEV